MPTAIKRSKALCYPSYPAGRTRLVSDVQFCAIMPVLWNFVALVVLTGAPVWGRSGSISAQGGDAKPPITKPPQTAPDQTSPAPPADSTKLEAIKTQRAIYPYEARNQKIQGEVVVKILISETGDVESAEIVSGDPILAKSAMDAVKKWKFKPFIKNGKPVKVSTKLPMDFAFSDKIMEKGVSADGSTTTGRDVLTTPSSLSSSPTNPSAATSGNTPNRVEVASGVSRGLLIRQVAPVYPDEARRAHIQGTVVLQAVIGEDGRVTDLQFISGPRELARAAIGAVQQWRYRPYLLMGKPVEVTTQIQVNFRLR